MLYCLGKYGTNIFSRLASNNPVILWNQACFNRKGRLYYFYDQTDTDGSHTKTSRLRAVNAVFSCNKSALS